MTNYSYLLIGNGRLAHHLRLYLQSQNIRVSNWNRKENSQEDFERLASQSHFLLLAIKDAAIESFILDHPSIDKSRWIHFSGSLGLPQIASLHPLMTFTEKLYAIDFYKRVPFISEKEKLNFNNVFPQLENPSYEIESNQKAFYHSLCVMSGNFTTLLWNKVSESFKTELNLPPDILIPYLQKITENLIDHFSHNLSLPLSGPLHRKDIQTILANLNALKNDSYLNIYKSFVKATDSQISKELNI